jgi:flagellar biosynthesis/type III secretory pathway M-ring protein FliF/YscJ
VFITTKGEPEHMKEMVRAAADGVAHAVSGLTPSEISVIINGNSMRVPDSANEPLSGGGDDLIERRAKREALLEQKIRNQFSFISGLTVTVNCDVEVRQISENKVLYNKDGTVVVPTKTTSVTDESSTSVPTSREPGVISNTNAGSNGPASIDGGGSSASGGNTQNTSKEDVINQVGMGHTDTTTVTPAGKDTVQTATVRVPTSYFAAIYKHVNPGSKDADPPSAFADAELAKIRQGVKTVVGLKSDTDLSVETYSDIATDLAMATGPAVQASALTSVGGHAKEIGIGVLAIVSLLMMATLVRKSSPAPVLVGALGGGVQSAGATGNRACGGPQHAGFR